MTPPAERRRRADFVLVSSNGSVRGAIGPVDLPEPWWEEVGPVADVLPGAVVLRLLNAEADTTGDMGGQVTYLVEYDGPIPASLEVVPFTEALVDHPLRLPWAEIGGPTADLAWVASVVDVDPVRPARQHRTWNLSTIWSIPLADSGDGADDGAWLKCVPPFFAHEARVLDLMADQAVPQLIAVDGHRMLLRPMPGQDGYGPNPDEELAMVESLVDIQWNSIDRVEGLLEAGVPDLRFPTLNEELTALVERVTPDDQLLTDFVAGLGDRLDRVAGLGMPEVLLHGDPHGGNTRRGTDPILWFDWGDSFIGHPLLDVAAHHRMSQATVDHWLRLWAEKLDSDDVAAVWPALEPVALLRMAWVYQRFCDNIEPSERVYHQSDVTRSLDAVRSWLSANEDR